MDIKQLSVLKLSHNLENLKEDLERNSQKVPNTKVIILTQAGQITGDIVNFCFKPSQKENSKLDIAYIFGSDNSINKDSIIFLRDAILEPYLLPDMHIKYDQLALFTDQILGITYST